MGGQPRGCDAGLSPASLGLMAQRGSALDAAPQPLDQQQPMHGQQPSQTQAGPAQTKELAAVLTTMLQGPHADPGAGSSHADSQLQRAVKRLAELADGTTNLENLEKAPAFKTLARGVRSHDRAAKSARGDG